MDSKVPKFRHSLNDKQIKTLKLIYRFRFITPRLLASYEGSHNKTVYFRLKVLCDQEYIGKHYDSSYKLVNKQAEYFLLPKGLRTLKGLPDFDTSARNSIYKDRHSSEEFRRHSLKVFQACTRLKAIYGDKISCFTKSDLRNKAYSYFPDPLPDMFVRLKTGNESKQFFLDVYETSIPFYQYRRKLTDYINYELGGDWQKTKTPFPAFLAIGDTEQLYKRLNRQISRTMDESIKTKAVFYSTTLEGLGNKTPEWLHVEDNKCVEI